MHQDRLSVLLEKYKRTELSPSEWSELSAAALTHPELEELIQQDLLARMGNEDPVPESAMEKALERVLSIDKPVLSVPPVHRVHFLYRWGWAAASIVLLLSVGAYRWMADKKNAAPVAIAVKPIDIVPGKEGATLTLADGSRVSLDSLGNGVIARQNGSQVVLKKGQLTYAPAGEASSDIAYNTMSTPKGRQFRVVLPDGTQVWLNAASSIRYPTAFTGKERKVEIAGEAYFEVVKDAQKPFHVAVNNKVEVAVLGTHFNVNAYENERSINTTLLEGAVSVTLAAGRQPGRPVVIKPGQQAQIMNTINRPGNAAAQGQQASAGITVINNADLEKVMAWKKGLFNFEGASLQEVMRQLERWYDIEVVYENGVPDIRFVGEMEKNISLQDLLDILGKTRVHFRMEEGRRLVVMP